LVSPVAGKRKLEFIKRDVPLKDFTTWNVGGPARFFCEPETLHEVREALQFSARQDLDLLFIGNGSNLLVPDEGFPGLAVRFGPGFGQVKTSGESITASAGTPLYRLANKANELGCSCFNFLTGIPGTVGGGLAMNAGAFGWEITDYLTKITYIDRRGEIYEREIMAEDFGYRESFFQKNKDLTLLEAEFRLDYGVNQPEMGDILDTRRAKFPYTYPSAGSVFKNPTEADSCAGELLDEAGAKGFSVGDAVVSRQHANFILNKGHATANNIQKTIDILRDRVYKEFGVTLVTEVTVI